MKTTLGGERLGSGNKQQVSMRNYERSTHDLSYLWRSSMAAGTLVPFMSEVALPGDSFDIELNCDVMTLPTIGPLFGSYKVQLDVFQCPIRLYNGKLHMNKLGIGMDMSKIKLPQIYMQATSKGNSVVHLDNDQINPSSIYSYLNIRGLGRTDDGNPNTINRYFNALSLLSYWDIYKNYYANKQEERGFVIHNNMSKSNTFTILGVSLTNAATGAHISDLTTTYHGNMVGTEFNVIFAEPLPEHGEPKIDELLFDIDGGDATVKLVNYYRYSSWKKGQNFVTFSEWMYTNADYEVSKGSQTEVGNTLGDILQEPQLYEFPLTNIDNMREAILQDVASSAAFEINEASVAPYGLGLKRYGFGNLWSKRSPQEGLGLKTYQSDLLNNWISTEWIEGENGINEISAVSTSGDSFTIDALNLANKVYNMLNRIAISGGTYDDWLDAVYTHERAKSVESPIYHGSLIKELAFEEVISNAATETTEQGAQPLGELAGRGRLTQKNKGGSVRIKIDEPSYIIGIVSLTPRLDYSQGNKWDVNLKTMNDFHKPALDEIGFQDLITDQMAWFDTVVNGLGEITYKSAGKQPAWINYMTNLNQCRGNFAEKEQEMFMTLNRRYECGTNGIDDVTTYIDPSKFNYIFAQTNISSQNFWVQISSDITARRKMSAKIIPNL